MESKDNNILFLKGINLKVTDGFLDFMIVKGIEIGAKNSKLIIYLKCSENTSNISN